MDAQQRNYNRFTVQYYSNIGKVRSGQEDNYLVSDGLFAVFDGMGGHDAGEVASKTAKESLVRAHLDSRNFREMMSNLVLYFDEAMILSGDYYAGTTAIIAEVKDNTLLVGNIGDSRCMVFRDDEVVFQSKDQCDPVRKNILLNCLCSDSNTDVTDTYEFDLQPGDKILLTSDGVHDYMDDKLVFQAGKEFVAALKEAVTDMNIQAIEKYVQKLGARDNHTAILVEFKGG